MKIMRSLKIGDLKIKNPLFLAPMVDVTDLAYRMICRNSGCAMAYIEMINTGAIIHENKKTLDLLKTVEKDKPLGLQITSPSLTDLKKSIPVIKKYNYDLIDINCGCPSIRTVDNQSGSYLLKSPKKIASYIKELKKSGFTTTAKIRLGFKTNNVIKIAKEIEKAGADALTVHARLALDSYKIPARYQEIEKIKKTIGIPIIGNGDILNERKAEEMLNIADGAMIARGAIGDPLIFERILFYLKTGKTQEFNYKKNLNLLKEYLDLTKKYEIINIPKIKYLGSNFIKGFEGASKLRNEFMHKSSFEEIKDFVKRI
jgi:tRNA-dihydrouridine synthase B